MQPKPLTARRIATEVLTRVDQDGVYANLELDKRLRSTAIDTRDKALATELVYGTLRWRAQLDSLILKASTRTLEQMPPIVRNVLRLAVYQLLHLTSIPSHAAVNEAVNLTRELGHPGAAGFVNAIARRIAREGVSLEVPANTLSQQLAISWSHPEWLVDRWLRNYGQPQVEELLKVNQEPAPLIIRVNTCRIQRSVFLHTLEQANISARPGATPEAVIVGSGTSAHAIPGYEQGWFVVQDESSQLVAHAMNPQPGEIVADLCSAPGGKATHLAQLMGDQGEIVALELHPHRAKLVADTARKLGLQSVKAVHGDSRNLQPGWQERFDRVLLDAPCMGTGVLRRRVDLRWRLHPNDLQTLVALQRELLATAAKMVRPGGRLVYSTCSIEPEENQEQVAHFCAENPDFRRGSMQHLQEQVPTLATATRHPEMELGELQLLPGSISDGFFLSILERR